MKLWIAGKLRALAYWLAGQESDDELRARALGVIRFSRHTGTAESLIEAIHETVRQWAPACITFEVHGVVNDAGVPLGTVRVTVAQGSGKQ